LTLKLESNFRIFFAEKVAYNLKTTGRISLQLYTAYTAECRY